MSTITWFSTSPDAGDPSCLCSWCEQPISEDEAPFVRLFNTETRKEARFHQRCATESEVLAPLGLSDVERYELEYGESPF